MARLDQLSDNFMQSFLRNNPQSLVDSNGYLRSEYEAELARRATSFPPPPANSVPDPRNYSQFRDIPFESEEAILFDVPIAEQAAPIIEKSKVDLQAAYDALMADTGWKGDGPLIVPAILATNVLLTPAPEIPEGQPRLRVIAEPIVEQSALGEDQKYAVEPELHATSDPTDTAEPPDPIRTDAEDVKADIAADTAEPLSGPDLHNIHE